MFNLDEAISDWRRKMSAGGIETPAILDELESHLREDAEKLAKSGVLSEAEAFMVAASRVGQSELLRAEFAKIGGVKEARLVKMIGVGSGIFAVLFTLWAARWLLFRSHEISVVATGGWVWARFGFDVVVGHELAIQLQISTDCSQREIADDEPASLAAW